MKTIDKIVTKLDTSRGAPMGRFNKYPNQPYYTDGKHLLYSNNNRRVRIYNCAVPMSSDGAYDRGGAYWGIGKQLRVSYTKALDYVIFYRR